MSTEHKSVHTTSCCKAGRTYCDIVTLFFPPDEEMSSLLLQEDILELVRQGKNVFFTGNAGANNHMRSSRASLCSLQNSSNLRRGNLCLILLGAGTGKSFLLNRIVDKLREDYGSDFIASVAICASTGIAATHVGGLFHRN